MLFNMHTAAKINSESHTVYFQINLSYDLEIKSGALPTRSNWVIEEYSLAKLHATLY